MKTKDDKKSESNASEPTPKSTATFKVEGPQINTPVTEEELNQALGILIRYALQFRRQTQPGFTPGDDIKVSLSWSGGDAGSASEPDIEDLLIRAREGDWRAAARLLEIRFPERWGPQDGCGLAPVDEGTEPEDR